MYIKLVILCIPTDLRAVLVGDHVSVSYGVLCMHNVAEQDPLGSHVGFLLSMPMGNTSEVVPAGYSDGCPFGVTAGDCFK
eukprot:1550751-Ditylum_brightwellii.AAC.1